MISGWDETDFKLTESALSKLKSKGVGSELINKIEQYSKNGKFVRIDVTFRIGHSAKPVMTSSQMEKYEFQSQSDDFKLKGAFYLSKKPASKKGRQGTGAIINFDPSESLDIVDGLPYKAGKYNEAFICLAHELIHAYRFMKGNSLAGHGGDVQDSNSPIRDEENRVVGLGKYQERKITENSIRKEHNLPLRKAYLMPAQKNNYILD